MLLVELGSQDGVVFRELAFQAFAHGHYLLIVREGVCKLANFDLKLGQQEEIAADLNVVLAVVEFDQSVILQTDILDLIVDVLHLRSYHVL